MLLMSARMPDPNSPFELYAKILRLLPRENHMRLLYVSRYFFYTVVR
jgi:hypothetical protein